MPLTKSHRMAHSGQIGLPFSGKKPSQKHGIDGRFVAVFCTVCGDDGTVMCPRCNGSGEGMADGSRCLECFGTGSVPCPGEMHGEV